MQKGHRGYRAVWIGRRGLTKIAAQHSLDANPTRLTSVDLGHTHPYPRSTVLFGVYFTGKLPNGGSSLTESCTLFLAIANQLIAIAIKTIYCVFMY